MRSRESFPILAILIVAHWAPAIRAAESELVMVQVQDGRVLVGEVDQRTNDQELWIRATSPDLALSVGLPWNQVAWIQHANRQFKPDRFRRLARELAAPLPKGFFREPQIYTHPEVRSEDSVRNGRVYMVRPPAAEPTAETLIVQAHVANWDGDAETDGLELTIVPQSSTRNVAPLDGVLVVELQGRKYRSAPRRSPIVDLEKWSLRVRSQDFGPLGATYRLPFQTFFPSRDPSIARDGTLRVQLTGGRTGPLKARILVPMR
jgi:hypothetical protein